jgi:hypothetical protein
MNSYAEVETAARKLAESEGRTWTSLTGDERIEMTNRVRATQVQVEVQQVADLALGHHEALDEVDFFLVSQIVAYVRSRPALGKVDKVALAAVAALSEHDPDFARSLMAQLAV